MPAAKLIQSRDNALFKTLLNFSKSSHARRKQGMTLLDGPHLIDSFHSAGHTIEVLAMSDSGATKAELRALFANAAAKQKIRLSDRLFQDVAAVNTPTGIMALVATPKLEHEPDVHADSLLLEEIQDPGNLGSIMRSAAAAGVNQILLSEGSVFAWSPKVLRAAMGAHFSLKIFEDCDLIGFAEKFQGTCIATEAGAKKKLFDLQLGKPLAWLLGNEGSGLSAPLARQAQVSARIPMSGGTESLNVAAAAAICLFEMVRQRGR